MYVDAIQNPFLLLFLLTPDVISYQAWREVMRGVMGPSGEESVWSWWTWVPLSFGRPLNLVLYIPFRIFAYSSNILKTSFDLMDSIPVCKTMK